MKVLVTGGAGYIGSHTCVELQNAGHDVVIVDNLCNSHRLAVDAVQTITGRPITFYEFDMRDQARLNALFETERIDAVIHFAALKAVGESVSRSLDYYQNNLDCLLVLCQTMQAFDVKRLVFSSSATVYGAPHTVPITEDFPLSATNPYGYTKLMGEQILKDLHVADPSWQIVLLRYFNPVGAHPSGLIGEDPAGIPNNLLPYITKVAFGTLECLQVFGGDYDTKDGTGVRDYIHVVDLAQGHIKALDHSKTGVSIYNLGTGTGYSVLEMADAFARISGRPVPRKIVERRPGDIAACYADASKARREIEWEAKRGLEEMCADAWNWQTKNPKGYETNA